MPAPEVVVEPVYVQPVLDLSKTQRELFAAVSSTADATEKAAQPIGFNYTDVTYSVDVRNTVLTDRSTICVRPSRATVRFGISTNIIYVSNELPPNSCIFHEVFDHEMVHVHIDHRLLREMLNRLQAVLRQALDAAGPIVASSEQDGVQRVTRLAQDVVDREMHAYAVERQQRHGELDTPEEYRRVTASCGSELFKYISLGH
ncbi:MAG TPA: hypothetical protein VKQ27_16785 [Acetobacteraceae bacterium]|nr:hypothetical protein [Acetobacteraceae bacterium]